MTHRIALAPPETDSRWALAIAGSNDGIWDWDIATGQVFLSDRWTAMLGQAHDELGATWDEWVSRVHPHDLERVTKEVQRHLAGESDLYQCEHRVRHKEGHYLWVLDRGRAQFDGSGRALRMTGCCTDVTERHLAQDAAQNLSLELASILNLSMDGLVAFDRQGYVKHVTPVLGSMTGLDCAQVQGLNEDAFWALLVLKCKEHSRVGDVTYLRNNLGRSDNHRRNLLELLKPSGRVLMVTQQQGDTGTIGKVLHFRDVTHETEVDRLKSEFISTAAHELRTPLASIYGFSEILLNQETDEATRLEFTSIIYHQSQAMTCLLNEMLDLARIEARRQTDFVFESVNVRTLVESVLSGYKWPDGRAVAELTCSHNDLLVRVDLKKVRQVMVNVLSNAYKYSPEGGAVQIRVERLESEGSVPEVVIHFTDSGMGMTPAQLERVFDRFYRANPRSEIAGTGLGMSIVKEIMTLLNGRVQIDSVAQSGTRVSLYLPLAQIEF